jgi:Lysyl oxidase
VRFGSIIVVSGLGACGDNLARIDAPPPIDAAPGLPDLTLVADEMDGTTVVAQQVFLAPDCEVVEGCVGAPGDRRLLRFDTVTANIGTADLAIGAPPPPGVSEGVFVWSPCHMHHHVGGYAEYELRDLDGVVVSGHKQAFCLQDVEELQPGSGPATFTCTNQGISAGWADVYNGSIPCQWIDVTGVAPGTYTLHVRINATGQLPDSDPTNNGWTSPVSL